MSDFELNQGDDIIVAIDVSASMQTRDVNGMSRIDAAKEATTALAREASKHDTDGIDVLTFGHTVTEYRGINEQKASDVIGGLKATESMTNTHDVIRRAYKLHQADANKQTVLLIITDGEPSNRDETRKAIIEIANGLQNEHEFAISFLTVGNVTPELQTFLEGLDDLKKEAKFDIVDQRPLEGTDLAAAFSGALHD